MGVWQENQLIKSITLKKGGLKTKKNALKKSLRDKRDLKLENHSRTLEHLNDTIASGKECTPPLVYLRYALYDWGKGFLI
jgi:hypothetical protein